MGELLGELLGFLGELALSLIGFWQTFGLVLIVIGVVMWCYGTPFYFAILPVILGVVIVIWARHDD